MYMGKEMKSQKNPVYVIMIILAGIMWGCIGIFIRHLNAYGLTSLQITSTRCVLNVLLMAILILLTDKSRFHIRLRDLGWFAANGLCSILVFYTAYQSSITLTSMPTAVALLYTAPAFVMILSVILFHEKLTTVKMVALVLSVGGSALVSGIVGGMVFNRTGILLGLLSGLGYALYSIFGTIILRKYHAFTNVFYSFVFAAAGSICICHPADMAGKIGKTPAVIPWIVGCALVTSFLSYLFYTAGLSKVQASRAAVYVCIEPVVGTVLGMLLYKEKLGAAGFAGIVMVLTAILLLNAVKEN